MFRELTYLSRPQERPLKHNYAQTNFRNASGVKRKPTGHTQRVVSLKHITENTINKIQVR